MWAIIDDSVVSDKRGRVGHNDRPYGNKGPEIAGIVRGQGIGGVCKGTIYFIVMVFER